MLGNLTTEFIFPPHNSLRPSDAYMNQPGNKPLSEPMLEYCQFEPYKKPQWNHKRNLYIFIQENAFENVICKMAAIVSWPQCAKQKLYLKPQNMKNIKHFKFYSPWAIYTCLLSVYSRYLPLNNLLQVLKLMPPSSSFICWCWTWRPWLPQELDSSSARWSACLLSLTSLSPWLMYSWW